MAYATWQDEACHEVLAHPDEPILDARACLLGDAGYVAERKGDVVFRDDPLPARDAALALLVDPATGKPTSFQLHAKATLPKASIFYAPCFDPSKPFAPVEGLRYTRLRSAVAWASCYLLQPESDITPLHIFGLFVQQVEQWGDDGDGTTFVERLWVFAQHFFALDEARVKQQQLEAQIEARDTHSVVEGMLEGVAGWYPAVMDLEPQERRRWLVRHLIVSLAGSNTYYVMDTTGHYSPLGVLAAQLVSTMIQQGLGKVVPLKNEEGKMRPPADLLNAYSSVVASLRFECGLIGSKIEDVDTNRSTLCFGIYARRTDLPGEWNDEVDGWLRALAGERYPTLCEWISHALAFDECALPMLLVNGDPDIGKKLLVMGLAECLYDATTADGESLLGDWNDPLLRSPFVWFDEGLPSIKSAKHPSDRMREVIGAPEIRLKRRFKDVATLRTNLRLIVTANDFETIAKLGFGKELNAASRRALVERVIHVPGNAEAGDYLRSLGGMNYTAKPGARWIRGDGTRAGGASSFIVAKHFMKLYEMGAEARATSRHRFVMNGLEHNDASVMDEMRATSGGTPDVLLGIFRVLNQITDFKKQSQFPKLWIDEDLSTVFVLAGGIYEVMKADTTFSERQIPSLKKVGKCLENICVPIRESYAWRQKIVACTRGRYLLLSRRQLGAQSWKALDTELLIREARRAGYPVPILERLVEGAEVLKFPEAEMAETEQKQEATA